MVDMIQYTSFDIDSSNVKALDKYLKTIIVNTKKRFLTKESILSSNEIFLEDIIKNSEIENSTIYYIKAPYLRIASVTHDFDNIESIDLLMQLSEIERDIIFSLLKGYKINEIAKMKGLSDKTIRKYRDIAVKKLKLYL